MNLEKYTISNHHGEAVRKAFLKMGHALDSDGCLVAHPNRADRHGAISLRDHKVAERYADYCEKIRKRKPQKHKKFIDEKTKLIWYKNDDNIYYHESLEHGYMSSKEQWDNLKQVN